MPPDTINKRGESAGRGSDRRFKTPENPMRVLARALHTLLQFARGQADLDPEDERVLADCASEVEEVARGLR